MNECPKCKHPYARGSIDADGVRAVTCGACGYDYLAAETVRTAVGNEVLASIGIVGAAIEELHAEGERLRAENAELADSKAKLAFAVEEIERLRVEHDELTRSRAELASERAKMVFAVEEIHRLRVERDSYRKALEMARVELESIQAVHPCPNIHVDVLTNCDGRCPEDSDDPDEWCISAKAKKALFIVREALAEGKTE